jgi:CubicO group peptidase (beta-lactamase class C family)
VEDPLEFKPGEGYGYNSFDSVLLSLAMERAGGRPFHELVDDLVLGPIGMAHTHMEVPGTPVPGQAQFYTRRAGVFRPATPVDTRYKLAGGGYLSTVYDICRLGQAYLDGGIASRDVLEPFLTTQQVAGAPTYYGLGWQVSRDAAGRPYFGHVGNTVGGYSNFYVYPESGLVVCALINCSVPGIQPVLDATVEALHQSLPPLSRGGEPVLF